MPLIPATASAAVVDTHGLGALRPSASDAGTAPHALDHATELARRLGEPVLGGNRARLLHDGLDTVEAMCKAIDSARDNINIESRIVEADGPGGLLTRKLIERRLAGVHVNLLHDSLGSLATAPVQVQRLRDAGVRLCAYKSVSRWHAMTSHALQLRDHRKLLVVDGRMGFIGAASANGHSGASSAPRSTPPAGWRDLHVQLEGPAVRRLQQLFIAQWLRHSGCALQQARYFPPLAPVGTHRVGVATCEAGRRPNLQHAALLGAIGTARSHVLLTTAYLVPPRGLLRALVHAAERGVRVELLLPRADDFRSQLLAGRAHRARLLQAGVLIHERQHESDSDTLLHAKACVVDGVWASVGSSNIDWRSIVHNAEANLVVVDEGFARQLERAFRDAVARSRPPGQAAGLPSSPRTSLLAPPWASLWQRGQEMLARRDDFRP